MSKSTQITLRIHDDLLALLEARARVERRTLAAMAKVLLEDALTAVQWGKAGQDTPS